MTHFEEKKAILTAADASAIEGARVQAVNSLLNPDDPTANIVGVAAGVKWKEGEPTGEPALLALVTHKLDKGDLRKEDLVPTKLGEFKTDVLEVGFPMAEQTLQAPVAGDGVVLLEEEHAAPPMVAPMMLARRQRPAEGGYSVGHYQITAGTIATCVYDILPGGTTGGSPVPGAGIPPHFYVLSNNHVLANVNNASIGDPILQPGPFDGGTDPADRIATLSRFIPIMLDPPIARAQHRNLVDAAVAEGQFHDLDREVYWAGRVRGWRRKANVAVGSMVQKTGRTTNYTVGRITAINATVDIGYGGGRVGRFHDQIILTNMSAGGDSGSLVMTLDEVAVGLLFAGSAVVTIANQIENVRSLLRVEVAEQVL
jgi:hypothetical protein